MNTNQVSRQRRRGSIAAGLSLCGAILLLAGCGGGSRNQSATPQTYTITDLGAGSNEPYSRAVGINVAGHVTGNDYYVYLGEPAPPPDYHPSWQPFIYNGAQAAINLSNVDALGINQKDHVLLAGNNHTYLYANGITNEIAALASPFQPKALNAMDQIAGDVTDAQGNTQATIYDYNTGKLLKLGTLAGGSSSALGINDNGQAVGTSTINSNPQPITHAVLFANNTVVDLGTLAGDTTSAATGINNGGLIIGNSESGNRSQAFIYQNGQMVALGTLPGDSSSQATALNDKSQIVGYSYVGVSVSGSGVPAHHPFLYSSGSLVDLNARLPSGSGWTLTEAIGINNAGQICGTGLHYGQPRAFLMTPQ